MAHSTDEKKLKYRNEMTVMYNDTIILPIDFIENAKNNEVRDSLVQDYS